MKKFLSLIIISVFAWNVYAQATIGYLTTITDPTKFPEEVFNGVAQKPEYNAYTWFDNHYVQTGKGRFITLDEVRNGHCSDLKAIWVNVDRVGLKDLAAAGITANIILELKKYVENGGNLFVTKQANMLINAIGRIGYAPNWTNGGYMQGGDVWHINPHLCLLPVMGGEVDCSTHPIYTNLYTQQRSFDYEGAIHEYSAYPLVGAVARTDNNNMWIDMFRKDPTTGGKMEPQEGYTHYDNTDRRRLTDFETDWNCKVLAVWGQVLDACSPGLIIFNPHENFKGTIISCGFAAYQWGTSNDMISNVQRLSKNALSLLIGEEPEVSIPTDTTTTSGQRVFYMNMELDGKYTKEQISDQSLRVLCTATDPISVDGAVGKAIRTDGYSTYITVNLNDEQIQSMGSNALTFSLWCAPQTYPMMQLDYAKNVLSVIAGNMDENKKTGMALRLSSQGDFCFDVYLSDGQRISVPATYKMPRGVWNHLAATISDKYICLYHNGERVGHTEYNGQIAIGKTSMIVGKPSELQQEHGCHINTFNGILDEIAIDTYAWSAAQVAQAAGELAGQEVDLSVPFEYYKDNILRPHFHGMPSANWSNETHGIAYENGKYHVFFQKNGNGPYMSRLHWGHITSTDLCEWKEETIALYPEKSYDIKGCWSGAVINDPDVTKGETWLVYTGVDNSRASMRFARPIDKEFLHFEKVSTPAITGIPGGYSADFRDPYYFRCNDKAYLMVGSSKSGIGCTILFEWNGSSWVHKGECFVGRSKSECGEFFEMANITKIGNKWLFTATPLGTSQGVRNLYWVGQVNANGKFIPDSPIPKTIEFSGFAKDGYGLLSPSIIQHEGKTIALGIVPDKLPTSDNRLMGWAHSYSLPREWSIDANGDLVQKPYSGLVSYRSDTVLVKENFKQQGVMALDSASGRGLEVCAEFIVSEHITGFELLRNRNGKGVKIYFDPMEQNIVVDMTSVTRKYNDNHLFRGKYVSTLPQVIAPGEKMKLHVFLDRSILDIFINDRWASSVRIFPTNEAATGTSFYTHGETQVERLEAYIMGDGYFPAPQMTDVENVTSEDVADTSIKYLQNGQIYISKNGRKYNLLGLEL